METRQINPAAVRMSTFICNGEKEFIFFTADVAGFMERLTNMPQEEGRYPITIERYDDPDWSYFEALIS